MSIELTNIHAFRHSFKGMPSLMPDLSFDEMAWEQQMDSAESKRSLCKKKTKCKTDAKRKEAAERYREHSSRR